VTMRRIKNYSWAEIEQCSDGHKFRLMRAVVRALDSFRRTGDWTAVVIALDAFNKGARK
jgi:hypothetical protein